MSYITGPPGPRGPQGVQGETTIFRITGPQGESGGGSTGPQGPQGRTITGPTGMRGPQGIKGETTIFRITGPQGKGITGPQGADGVTGPQGTAGIDGIIGIDGVTGPQGYQGADGVTGPQGDIGVGVQGPTGPGGGDKGETGVTGPQGADGVTGPQGADGVTGPQGADGVSITGPTGINISEHNNLSGLQGGTTGDYVHLSTLEHDKLHLKDFGLTSGIIRGGKITKNVDGVRVDIEAGESLYVDLTDLDNPVIEVLTWGAQTLDPHIYDYYTRPWIGVERTGTGTCHFILSESFTPLQKRTVAVLGRAWTTNNTTVANVGQYSSPSFYLGNTLIDLINTLGALNRSGNTFGPNGSNLKLDKSVGRSFRFSANFLDSPLSPNIQEDVAISPVSTYSYHLSNASTTTNYNDIQVNHYDVDGVLTLVPDNMYTIQSVYYFPKSQVVDIIYGHNYYSTMDLALANIGIELVDLDAYNISLLEGAILRSKIVVRQGTSSLSDPDFVRFVEVSNLGTAGAAVIGLTRHNQLTGLNQDDHPQYLTTGRADSWIINTTIDGGEI